MLSLIKYSVKQRHPQLWETRFFSRTAIGISFPHYIKSRYRAGGSLAGYDVRCGTKLFCVISEMEAFEGASTESNGPSMVELCSCAHKLCCRFFAHAIQLNFFR